MSHNFIAPKPIDQKEIERLRIAFGTYVCDLVNFDQKSLADFVIGKSLSEIAIEIGWLMGALMSQVRAEESNALAISFSNGKRLSEVMVPYMLTSAEARGEEFPAASSDGRPVVNMPIPPPSHEDMTERPQIQLYLLKPDATVQ